MNRMAKKTLAQLKRFIDAGGWVIREPDEWHDTVDFVYKNGELYYTETSACPPGEDVQKHASWKEVLDDMEPDRDFWKREPEGHEVLHAWSKFEPTDAE